MSQVNVDKGFLAALAESFGAENNKAGNFSTINEEITNNSSISIQSGTQVKFSGSGVGGNGFFDFGDEGEAKAFHDFLEDLREIGLLEEVLSGDLGWNSLATAAGATKSRELVGNINEDRLWNDAVRERVNEDTGETTVVISGRGVGGNANAKFAAGDEDAAKAFSDLMETLIDKGFADEIFGL